MFAKPAVKLLVKFFCETYSIELNLFGKYEILILYKGSHNFQLLKIVTIPCLPPPPKSTETFESFRTRKYMLILL